jgi:hypothetical protein
MSEDKFNQAALNFLIAIRELGKAINKKNRVIDIDLAVKEFDAYEAAWIENKDLLEPNEAAKFFQVAEHFFDIIIDLCKKDGMEYNSLQTRKDNILKQKNN